MDYLKEAAEAIDYMRRMHGCPVMKELLDISQGEMAVLNYLMFTHDGATAGELSSRFDLVTSRIAAILNSLTRKGLAERIPDSEDRRRVLVYITEKGQKEVLNRKKHAEMGLAGLLEVLGEQDAKEFLRMIKKVAEHEIK